VSNRREVTPETCPELDRSPFPCLVCGRVLCNVVSVEQSQNQPYEACAFNSHGHYGCTVMDSFDGEKLEINVCDECLLAAQKLGRVGYWAGLPKRKLEPWTERFDDAAPAQS
jgi:hypothetical protein